MCVFSFDRAGVVRVICLFFFFQAEDGIRDLVRSRGLGDVYKRQVQGLGGRALVDKKAIGPQTLGQPVGLFGQHRVQAVSYTHLTLPTSDLV